MAPQFLGRRARSAGFDVGVACVVAVLTLVEPSRVYPPAPRWIGFAMAAALLVRRRWPLSVMAAVSVLALVQVLVQPAGAAVLYDVAVLIAMYTTVKYGRRLQDCLLALAPVCAGILVEVLRGPAAEYRWVVALWYGSVCSGIWAVGYTVRTRRLYIASLEERAATAEREREHLARIAVGNERAAIARELHDIVAHSLAVMVVQADGAAYTFDRDSDGARTAIKQVATTGREALEDMRRLVHVLRDRGDGGSDGRDDRAGTDAGTGPAGATSAGTAPGSDVIETGGIPVALAGDRRRITLDQLGALVERANSAGLIVTMSSTDLPAKTSPTIELAAYRIVQESLTNALRHAGPGAAVAVDLGYRDGELTVDITDDGRGARDRRDAGGDGAGSGGGGTARPDRAGVDGRGRLSDGSDRGGHGLIGMRERVAAHGGRFSAGPRAGAGWRVRAIIPVPAPEGTWPVKSAPLPAGRTPRPAADGPRSVEDAS